MQNQVPCLTSIKKNHFRLSDPPGILLHHVSVETQLKNELLSPRPEIFIDFLSCAGHWDFIKRHGPEIQFPFLKSIKKKSLSCVRSTRDTFRYFLN